MWNTVNFGNYENCVNFKFYDEKAANYSPSQFPNFSNEIYWYRGQHCFVQLNFVDQLTGNTTNFSISNGFCVPRFCSPKRTVYWLNIFYTFSDNMRMNYNVTFAQCKLQNEIVERENIDYATM